jgi:gliding motility-associated lipoprotein GldD
MNKHIIILSILVGITFAACRKQTTPKPTGYFRIEIPENEYKTFDDKTYPYTFELSKYAEIVPKTNENEKYWVNIYYPQFDGTIHGSYITINDNLQSVSEDTREFVYKHTVKADAISEQPYINAENHTSGILYRLEGNTASPVQFFVTDSTKYFFRGALYFNAQPNKDSIAPVLNFIQKDIVVLMETFQHK